jgi:uncharacterized protein YecA (UPF0149 family)
MTKATYRELRDFLQANDTLEWSQFTIDWIERKIDDWDERERMRNLSDDATIAGAIHYEADNILAIMRIDVKDRDFFERLRLLADPETAGQHNSAVIQKWKNDPNVTGAIRPGR